MLNFAFSLIPKVIPLYFRPKALSEMIASLLRNMKQENVCQISECEVFYFKYLSFRANYECLNKGRQNSNYGQTLKNERFTNTQLKCS